MKKITKILALVLALIMVLGLCACGSNTDGSKKDEKAWPAQPVNVVVPATAGGGLDNMIRLLNEYFVKKTGMSLVVENIPNLPGYEKAYQANPDGYNFIFGTTTIFTTELDGSLTYDWDDYEMVAYGNSPYNGTCIAVRNDSPYKTINELLDAIKADPDKLTGGTTLTGQPYMCQLALEDVLGYKMYTTDVGNANDRNAALLGGHVDYIINNTTSCAPYVASGDFRLLVVFGEERVPTDPDVPTFKDCGIDFAFPAQPSVYLAPKGTSAEACEAFNKILREINEDPDYVKAAEEKLKMIGLVIFDVAQSKVEAQKYKDTLAPYVKK